MLPDTLRTLALILLTGAAVGRELGAWSFPLPQRHRQLAPWVLDEPGRFLGSLRFGAMLGTGIFTFLPTSMPLLTFVALLLLEVGPASALMTGASFGLGRAVMPVMRYHSSDGRAFDRVFAQRLSYDLKMSAIFSAICILALIWRLGVVG